MARPKVLLALVPLVAVTLLYLSLRGIQWTLVARTVASLNPGLAALSIALGLIPMFLRAVRWRILLLANAPVSLKTAFWAVAAGYFGNNFLPARGGELVRSYIVRERSSLPGSYILATALTERVADAVALVITGALVLLFLPQADLWIIAARGSLAVMGIVGITSLICLPLLEKPVGPLLTRWPQLQTGVQQMLLGVRSLHNAQRLLLFTALTAFIWALDAIATTTLAHALRIAMPVSVAMLLIVALSLSSALPSTPGYVGVYQFVAVSVLGPYGIPQSSAVAFILVTQALNYLITSTLGLLAITRFTPVDWRAFRHPRRPLQAPPLQAPSIQPSQIQS